jgi:hypothetical protein
MPLYFFYWNNSKSRLNFYSVFVEIFGLILLWTSERELVISIVSFSDSELITQWSFQLARVNLSKRLTRERTYKIVNLWDTVYLFVNGTYRKLNYRIFTLLTADKGTFICGSEGGGGQWSTELSQSLENSSVISGWEDQRKLGIEGGYTEDTGDGIQRITERGIEGWHHPPLGWLPNAQLSVMFRKTCHFGGSHSCRFC